MGSAISVIAVKPEMRSRLEKDLLMASCRKLINLSGQMADRGAIQYFQTSFVNVVLGLWPKTVDLKGFVTAPDGIVGILALWILKLYSDPEREKITTPKSLVLGENGTLHYRSGDTIQI
jgi:hypothetical protein